jgi:FkbM family methyltransferase
MGDMNRRSDKEALEQEEKGLIRAYFDGRKNGIFVEVGAHEPVGLSSQSWHLEKKLNWSGLLIEPNPELAKKARLTRPGSTVFEVACTSPKKSGHLTLYIPVKDGSPITSHASVGKNIDDHHYREHVEIRVKARTLDDLLDASHINRIDLLSIDVEGAEMDVLLGLSLDKYRPRLILLEDKHVYLTKHFYLKRKGYVLVKRTKQNCWYVPRGERRPSQTMEQKLRLLKRMYVSIWWKKVRVAFRSRRLAPLLKL